MVIVTANKFAGLSQGPVDHKASSVVNVICGGIFLNLGDGVFVISPSTNELLPRVDFTNNNLDSSQRFIGITVGGDNEGTYGKVGEQVVTSDTEDVAAFNGQDVRICTQGRCIARVMTFGMGAINIGDPLTPKSINGELSLQTASPTFPVVARALQQASLDAQIDDIQYIAVDVQREG